MTGEKSEHYKDEKVAEPSQILRSGLPILAPSWLRKRFSRTLAVTPK
jgi:hypothetical protein